MSKYWLILHFSKNALPLNSTCLTTQNFLNSVFIRNWNEAFLNDLFTNFPPQYIFLSIFFVDFEKKRENNKETSELFLAYLWKVLCLKILMLGKVIDVVKLHLSAILAYCLYEDYRFRDWSGGFENLLVISRLRSLMTCSACKNRGSFLTNLE